MNHDLAGRIAGATGIVSYCTCGLGFWGANVHESDGRFNRHLDAEVALCDVEVLGFVCDRRVKHVVHHDPEHGAWVTYPNSIEELCDPCQHPYSGYRLLVGEPCCGKDHG